MPRKPKFKHPLRRVRECLGYTQAGFSKLIGCSPITVQRIENGSLRMSQKLAYVIMEATGAEPQRLQEGGDQIALDMQGKEYSRASYDFQKKVLPVTDDEVQLLTQKLLSYSQLLLIASRRGTKFKTRAVFAEIIDALQKVACEFGLKEGINAFLVEQGYVDKRAYRVKDLRKYPAFARIVGFTDDKRFSPDKVITFLRPRGWIPEYFLHETAVLPPDVEMKLRPNSEYIIDDERPIPDELKKIVEQALYWEIKEFHPSFPGMHS